MSDGVFHVPTPVNEPVLSYAAGTPERAALETAIAEFHVAGPVEIPVVIDGQHIFTGNVVEVRNPSNHIQVLARVHQAAPGHVTQAIESAMRAKQEWAALPWNERVSVYLRAAELLAGPWRARVNAATMLGQGKTVHQAEIDAACELIDFWRFNAVDVERIQSIQPIQSPGIWNRMEYRPLDGFVFAVAPFNFTSIAANLPTAPTYFGNTALWKPAATSMFAVWQIMLLLEEAGLPAGVVNMIPGSGAQIGEVVFASPDFGGLHFTGSTPTFEHMWQTIGQNISTYKQYPRIVGETGGKDFVLVHPSADVEAVVTGLVRGAFEFQGQKCSAASRAYVPHSLWQSVKAGVQKQLSEMKMGDVTDFAHFVGPVIDEASFDRITSALSRAKQEGGVDVIAGGNADKSIGWFIEPTVCVVSDPKYFLMEEELFGPVLTVYVYDDAKWEETLELVDSTSPYALTGAVFANDRTAVSQATQALAQSAGNFYVNDKPTGAVVGQQPFGGGRKSGTNDKAGSMLNLLRWTSARSIKENVIPPKHWSYPFLDQDEA